MHLLRTKFVKKNHIHARIFLIFLKKRPKANLKYFKHQISHLGKRSGKQLPNKDNFSTFSPQNCCNFTIKRFESS